jgi:Protein of unknown function (DUF3822)
MLQPVISYFENDEIQFSQSDLLIYIGENSFSYAIVSGQKIVRLVKYSDNPITTEWIQIFMKEKGWKKNEFAQVKLSFNTNEFTIVPFGQQNTDDILNVLFGVEQNRSEEIALIEKHQVKLVYRLASELRNALLQHFEKVEWNHHVAAVINHYTHFSGNKIVLHCLDEYYSIVVFEGSKLIAAKTFHNSNNEKLSYQLLGLCQMYHITVSEVTVFINGWIHTTSQLFKELSKYFEAVIPDVEANTLHCDCADFEKHYYSIFEPINAIG